MRSEMSESKRIVLVALMLWLMAGVAALAQVERAELRIDGLT